jgi:phage terminase small subunit
MPKGNPNAKPPLSAREINQEKLEAFAQAYMTNGFNKCKAAITAGYAAKTAQARSSEIFKHPYVVKRLKEMKEEARKKFEVSHEKILKELAAVGFSDIGKFLEENNDVTGIKQLKTDLRRQVKKVKKTVTEFDGGTKTTVEIELHPKLVALDLIAKHVGFYNEDNKQKATVIRVGFKDK